MKLKIFLFTLTALLMFSSFASAAETKDYKLTAPAGKTNLTYTKDFYNELGDLKIEVDSTDNTATFPANTTISVKVSYDAVFKSTSDSTKTVAYKLVYGDNNTEVSNGGKINFTFATAASNKSIKIGAKITGESSGVPDGDYRSNITFVGLPVKGQKNYEFGKYDGQTLKWRVLDVDTANDRALLVTEKAVRTMKFHSSSNSWSGSDVRNWLNGDFLNGLGDDKAKIIKVKLPSESYNNYKGSNNSEVAFNSTDNNADSVFLLSVADVQDNGGYFSGNDDRKCGLINPNQSTCFWWLRSPGNDNNAVFVQDDGSVNNTGNVNTPTLAIRPAVWIDLN